MKQKKLISIALTLCMVLGMVFTVAATGEEVSSAGYSLGTGTAALQKGQYILYGGNEWLVLDSSATTTDVAGIAVISKDIVDANIAFNAGGLDNSWVNSDAKTWNSAYAAENLSALELAAILQTTKAEEAGSYFGANWSKDALDAEQLFFLSAAEIQDYFSDSIEGLIASCDDVADGWWLRSAYTDRGIYAGIVSDSGFVGYPHVAATWGARPAFNIAEESIVLTSAAVGGKVSGAAGADGLNAVTASDSSVWKLTVADSAHSSFAATIGDGAQELTQSAGYESWSIPVTYSGAVAGDNEFVSMIICNQIGDVVYYGHIAANSAEGSVNVNMPSGLSGKYTVSVFAEQCNGDNATDFGSALVSIPVVIDDGLSSVHSWGLVLEGDIRVDFLLNLTDAVVSDPASYVSITVDGDNVQTLVSGLTADENGLYKISANVAAAQMTEDIVVQIVTSDAAGSEFIYSVRKYADYLIENITDETTLNLVKAMLVYGGKAQSYFQYNLDDMADTGISIALHDIPYMENVSAVKTGSSSNVTYYGASLIHEHQTNLRIYFTSNGADMSSLTFSASIGDLLIDSDMKLYQNGTKYYVEITNIAPNQLCDLITVSVDGLSVTYSPFYYMHRMYYKAESQTTLKDLMFGMYNYYYYAAEYLG